MPIDLPTPLLRRTQLNTDESLESFLIRLASQNWYPSIRTIKQLYREKLTALNLSDNICVPRKLETYQILSALTKQSEYELFDATYHFFEPTFSTSGIEDFIEMPNKEHRKIIHRNTISIQRIRRSSTSAYCPQCLREATYHRKTWLPITVTACLTHQCLLWECCMVCGNNLLIGDIALSNCHNCHANLKDAQPIVISDDSLGLFAQEVVQAMLGLVPYPSDMKGFPDQPRSILYRVFEGLSSCVQNRKSIFDNYMQILPNIDCSDSDSNCQLRERHRIYLAAIKGLVDWPQGLFEFLKIYSRREETQLYSSMHDGFGRFFGYWLQAQWSGIEFAFIQEAFKQFILESDAVFLNANKTDYFIKKDLLLSGTEYIPITRAAHELHVRFETLQRLIEIGYLNCVTLKNYDSDWYKVLRTSEVYKAREIWLTGFTLQSASLFLGLSEEATVGLVHVGLLEAERGPTADGSQHWLFTPTALEGCTSNVTKWVRQVNNNSFTRFVDLTTAAKMVSVIGLNGVKLLREVRDRRIFAYWVPGSSLTLAAMHFKQSDLEDYVQVIKNQNRWCRLEDIAKRMGVKEKVARRWLGNGLLIPKIVMGSVRYFDIDAVDKFASEHIFAEVASELLQVGALTVQKWARQGRLEPVSGPDIDGCHRYLFRRIDIECLMPEKRLTASQMALSLGIGRSQFNAWIREGKIKPISGPGIDNCKHYLFIADCLPPPQP